MDPLPFAIVVFVFAGIAKGVLGMGLPTVAMGLLALAMPPGEASALLLAPSLVTNVWQMFDGGQLKALLRRFWPLFASVILVTVASSRGLARSGPAWASAALGTCLLAYGVIGLRAVRLRLPERGERGQSVLAGALTGWITGLTGVFVMPAVPFLQARGLDKQALTQALGISFTASTLALGAGLGWHGGLSSSGLAQSAWMLPPALLGMWLGQRIRGRLSEGAFRRGFFIGLALLGLASLLKELA